MKFTGLTLPNTPAQANASTVSIIDTSTLDKEFPATSPKLNSILKIGEL